MRKYFTVTHISTAKSRLRSHAQKLTVVHLVQRDLSIMRQSLLSLRAQHKGLRLLSCHGRILRIHVAFTSRMEPGPSFTGVGLSAGRVVGGRSGVGDTRQKKTGCFELARGCLFAHAHSTYKDDGCVTIVVSILVLIDLCVNERRHCLPVGASIIRREEFETSPEIWRINRRAGDPATASSNC